MVKPRLYGEAEASKKAAMWTLNSVLVDALKLLHPYMPFITEEIFCTLKEEQGTIDKNESIMISDWPVYTDARSFEAEEEAVELIKEAVKGIRNLRTEMNVPMSRKAAVFVVSESEKVRRIFENSKVFFASLGGASSVTIQADKRRGLGKRQPPEIMVRVCGWKTISGKLIEGSS